MQSTAGLDEGDAKFANELLASTLSQRAELVCHGAVRTPASHPIAAQAWCSMALADLEETLKINSEQPEAQYLLGRLYAHLGETDKGARGARRRPFA